MRGLVMSGIELTYDSRQDRLLLRTGMGIAMPEWWLTRRMVFKLLNLVDSVTVSQYETEKMLDQLTAGEHLSNNQDTNGDKENKTLKAFQEEQAGENQSKVTQSKHVGSQSLQFPLAVRIHVDITDQQGIRLILLDELNQGACLEFTHEGLYRFNNMLLAVMKKARWV